MKTRNNMIEITFGIRRILLLFTALAATLSHSGQVASEPDFGPFANPLRGLSELYFVKQSLGQQQHQGTLKRLGPHQAAKALQGADPLLGMEYDERVQAFLNFYTQQGNRRNVEIMLGLTTGYFPLFESFLAEEQMPSDLKYLPMALSSLNPGAVSRWGASGLWQIMYTNGRLYQLQIDSYVDERRDPTLSTRAALQHLKDLFGIYGSWDLAVAAYTNSPSNLNKAIRKAGGSKKYADLYPWLPVETRDYLPAFAACYILKALHEQAGLKPYEIHNPLQNMRVPVERRLHLGQAAEVLGISLEMLKEMNPEFKSGIVPAGNNRQYWIRLPSGYHERFTELSGTIYGYRDSLYFPVRQQMVVSDVVGAVTVPAEELDAEEDTSAAGATGAPEVLRDPPGRVKLTYTVKDGDNLGYIAGWYGTRVSDIRTWNGMTGDVIRVGQILDIWVPESRVQQYRDIDKMTFAEKQRGSTTAAQPAAQPPRQPAPATGSFTWYTVQRGETLTAIAARHPGVSADEIMSLNNIRDPRTLQAGQRIKIPNR